MPAYYNEHDPYAAQWLRNLITAGHIAPGDVDERSIEDVRPDDLRAYDQCHFFAGIGVWSHALRRAGWPDDRPVWTGSCPCQPFSAAGKGAGFDDERHLWPAWYWLIGECRPPVIFGEQVASSAVEPWIDLVHADLEAVDYAYGCEPFPSAGVGAPHIRDRAFWMAYANCLRGRRNARAVHRSQAQVDREGFEDGYQLDGSRTRRAARRLADADRRQRGGIAIVRGLERDGQDARRSQGRSEPESCGAIRRMANTNIDGFQGCAIEAVFGAGRRQEGHALGCSSRLLVEIDERAGPTNGFWRAADWLLCRDGKWRPVEPGTFPLVDGSAGGVGRVRADQERIAALRPRKDQGSRTGRLRGYGNAINAEAATQFILAADEILTT
ncbi:DNA cytosine methyltransferase [Burkholderia cenocepacia]|uniref:DNA cytosine methyltransferase n=1 Tax=Burkholderia cenocepacia TaxID=95486 RepID=UPI001CF4FFF1|nr:DNA cytosine methyltransferase [Burkholderia cenocepacia]MCA8237699.1 DNA cytosine methyltransferase [Burkholderia cenocepacia]